MSQWWSRIINTRWYSGYHRSDSRTAGGQFNSVSSCWAVLCFTQTSIPNLAISPSPRAQPLTIINFLSCIKSDTALQIQAPTWCCGAASTIKLQNMKSVLCCQCRLVHLASLWLQPCLLLCTSIPFPIHRHVYFIFELFADVLLFLFCFISHYNAIGKKKGCIETWGTVIPWMEVPELNFFQDWTRRLWGKKVNMVWWKRALN